METIITFIKKILPKKIKEAIINLKVKNGRNSYAQSGEDILIDFLINQKGLKIKKGFYVDIGAFDPDNISNTKFFYKKGWSGINIDAMPGSMKKFQKIRKRDINLEQAISANIENLDFYIFDQKSMNTFSSTLAQEYLRKGFKLIKKIKIKTERLENVLQKYATEKKIDLMSIDVEGLDLSVLKSNNWEKYRPHFLLIESADFQLEQTNNSPIYQYLKEKEYILISKISVNLLFEDKREIK